MQLGALLSPVFDVSNPRALVEEARMLEGEGYTSIWMVQAVGRGNMIMDPLVALTAAATATTTVELGTAILQVPLYDPYDLAHRVISTSQICGARLRLGVGAGSTENDFMVMSRDFASRFGRFDECTETLRSLLAEGEADGRSLDVWPALLGRVPMFLGSWGKGVGRAAGEFDGWIASGAYRSTEEVVSAHARYRDAGGRRAIVSTIQVNGETDLGALQSRLAAFDDAGFDDAVVMLLPGAPSASEIRKLI